MGLFNTQQFNSDYALLGNAMRISPQTYYDGLKASIQQPIVKIEILRNDETIINVITGDILNDGGNLTVTRQNGIRRSVEFSLINFTGNYIPYIDGSIWIRQKVKIYFGLKINDLDYWISQGIFILDNPTAISETTGSIVNIKALDKFSLLDGTLGGELDSNLVYPAGTRVFDIICNVLSLAGELPNHFVIDVDVTNQTISYPIEKTYGDKLGDILIEMANMLSKEVFYDINGNLVFQNPVDPLTCSSIWDFGTTECNYLGSSQEYKFSEVFNAVLVIGDNSSGQIYSYEAVNTNINSNISVNNLGFKRTKVITDTNIGSLVLAKNRAIYELNLLSMLQSSIKISIIPMFHLDVGNAITLTDPHIKLNRQRFLINGISVPFKIGEKMTLDGTIINNFALNIS